MALSAQLRAQLTRLSPADKQDAMELLSSLLATDEARTLETQPAPGGSYVLEYISCGKPNCKCARGELHGPYWYLHRSVGGRTVKKYLGKQRPL